MEGGCGMRCRAESESKEGRGWLDDDGGKKAGADGSQPGFELGKESGMEEERIPGWVIDEKRDCSCVGSLFASKRITAPGGVEGGVGTARCVWPETRASK